MAGRRRQFDYSWSRCAIRRSFKDYGGQQLETRPASSGRTPLHRLTAAMPSAEVNLSISTWRGEQVWPADDGNSRRNGYGRKTCPAGNGHNSARLSARVLQICVNEAEGHPMTVSKRHGAEPMVTCRSRGWPDGHFRRRESASRLGGDGNLHRGKASPIDGYRR